MDEVYGGIDNYFVCYVNLKNLIFVNTISDYIGPRNDAKADSLFASP